ncbi:hypothetical protein AAFF_G00251830 [Aldrovandia affinis]|uniref:Uncharacterized protein n=1 Tax=Aldrovandia affinis TaxID=143900 RepID=A0AAD7STT0_9TELE|nr:hypothetical protein AAFF_G00251830 [Aldrovandia affinis]
MEGEETSTRQALNAPGAIAVTSRVTVSPPRIQLRRQPPSQNGLQSTERSRSANYIRRYKVQGEPGAKEIAGGPSR